MSEEPRVPMAFRTPISTNIFIKELAKKLNKSVSDLLNDMVNAEKIKYGVLVKDVSENI